MSTLELIYCSEAINPLTEEDVEFILEGAQEKNRSLGITGMLIFCNGYFLQLIEGSRPAVNQLFQSISHDARHDRITISSVREVEAPSFGDWEMAYLNEEKIAAGGVKIIDSVGAFSPYAMSAVDHRNCLKDAALLLTA